MRFHPIGQCVEWRWLWETIHISQIQTDQVIRIRNSVRGWMYFIWTSNGFTGQMGSREGSCLVELGIRKYNCRKTAHTTQATICKQQAMKTRNASLKYMARKSLHTHLNWSSQNKPVYCMSKLAQRQLWDKRTGVFFPFSVMYRHWNYLWFYLRILLPVVIRLARLQGC